MQIELDLRTYVELDYPMSETEWQEFILNWNHQVPHWDYLTNDGINFFKFTNGVIYKDERGYKE